MSLLITPDACGDFHDQQTETIFTFDGEVAPLSVNRGSGTSQPHRQERYPQAPVDERVGSVGDRAHGSAMPSDRISREPVPLAECVAEVLAFLLERELNLPGTETTE